MGTWVECKKRKMICKHSAKIVDKVGLLLGNFLGRIIIGQMKGI
jgi:hypothetical protein